MTRIVSAAVLAAALYACGSAAAEEDTVRIMLSDPRLDARVSLEHRFVTVREALEEISRATRVPLKARSPVADQNIATFVTDRPAGEVLDVLGQTLGYTWRRRKAEDDRIGFELYQDRAGQLREERLRARRQSQGLRAIEHYLGKRQAEAIEAQRQIDLYLKLGDDLRRSDLPEAERQALTARREEALRQSRGNLPGQLTAFLQVARRLLPQVREPLLRSEIVRFSSARKPGFRPIPTWAGEAIVAERARQKAWAEQARTARSMEVKCFLGARWEDRRIALMLGREIVLSGAREAEHRTDSPGAGWFEIPFPPGAPEKGDFLSAHDPRLTKTVRPQLPQKKPRREDVSTYVRVPLLVDLLAKIHQEVPQLCFIADAHLRKLELPSDPKPGTALEVLNAAALASGSRLRWDPRGYVGVRSRTFFEDRPGSIPAPVLRELYQRAERTGRLDIMDYAWLASRLSDEQMDRSFGTRSVFSDWQLPALFSVRNLSQHRRELRLLASLTPDQHTIVKNGDLLRFAALAPAQQDAVRRTLNDSLHEFDAFRFWTDAELLRMGLKISVRNDADVVQATVVDIHYFSEGQLDPVLTRTCFF